MTWPTTQIATTNLDAGSDQPKLARQDLLDTVTAVNSIINHGDPRQYAVLHPIRPNYPGGATEWTFTEIFDPTGMITLSSGESSNSRFTLPAGTYLFEVCGSIVENNSNIRYYGLPLWDYTQNVTLGSIGVQDTGGYVVLTQSTSCGAKSSTVYNLPNSGLAVKITKLA
jgi:hypothetical protein